MSNNADYRAAKDDFNAHVARHQCKAKLIAEQRDLPVCETRMALWTNMMRVAANLGKEEVDYGYR